MKHNKARLLVLFAALGTPLLAQYGGFGGPSILSRGGGGARTGANPVGFNFHAGLRGQYSTNLNNYETTTGQPDLRFSDAYGATGSVGLQGYKYNARSATSVDLSLLYAWSQRRHAVSQGLSEALAFTHSRQLSRRVIWYFGANGQSSNRSVEFANERFSPEPLPELTPFNEEIFDSRMTRVNVGTGFTFQKSARLSFSGQGGAFGAQRKARQLMDSRGFSGTGTVQYSLSRRHQIGASGIYGTFYFPGRYGESSYYSPQVLYGAVLSRAWSLNLTAGYYHVRTDRLTTVLLDPFIAQLTGQKSTLEVFRGTTTGFSGGATLNGNYRRWGVTLSAIRGVRPGNGIYMTSERTTVSASVSHTLGRSMSFSLFARGSETKALAQQIGNARYYAGGTSFTYRINNYLSFNSNLAAYRTSAAGDLIKFSRLTASAGIFFSPGELPLHIF